MRPRIKKAILLASSNPETIQSYREKLLKNHNDNKEYFSQFRIEIEVNIEYNYYIKCFGKLIQITEQESKNFNEELIIKRIKI